MDATHTLTARFEELSSTRGGRAAIWRRRRADWTDVTWDAFHSAVEHLAKVLFDWGVGQGEHVAIMSRTRFEWLVVDQAIARVGAVSVSLPVVMDAELVHRALELFEVRVAFVEEPEMLGHFLRAGRPREGLHHIVYFDARGRTRDDHTPPVMLDDVASWPPDPRLECLDLVLEQPTSSEVALPGPVSDDACATVVFTAGTMGPRRAVPITHRGLAAAARAIGDAYALSGADVVLLAVPLSHLFGRLYAYGALQAGATLALGDRLAAIVDHMGEIQPTVVVAAPLVLERMTSRMSADATTGSPLRRLLFSWALDTGRQASVEKQSDSNPGTLLAVKLGIANRLVFKRIHESFGSRLRFFVSAGGSLSKTAAELFHAAGVLVLESYGQTEAGGLIAANLPESFRFGSVGHALPGVEWQIDEGLTLQVRTPWQPDAPIAAWQEPDGGSGVVANGWWDTDDLASAEDEWLFVQGRRAAQMTLSHGEVVHPRALEHALRAHPMIANAVVVGDGRPFVTALVLLDAEVTKRWADENGIPTAAAELTHDERVYREAERLIEAACQAFPPKAAIQKFALLSREMTPRTGELTELLEVRRPNVVAICEKIVHSFYGEAF